MLVATHSKNENVRKLRQYTVQFNAMKQALLTNLVIHTTALSRPIRFKYSYTELIFLDIESSAVVYAFYSQAFE